MVSFLCALSMGTLLYLFYQIIAEIILSCELYPFWPSSPAFFFFFKFAVLHTFPLFLFLIQSVPIKKTLRFFPVFSLLNSLSFLPLLVFFLSCLLKLDGVLQLLSCSMMKSAGFLFKKYLAFVSSICVFFEFFCVCGVSRILILFCYGNLRLVKIKK